MCDQALTAVVGSDELLGLGNALVGGADDLAGGHVLLHAVCAPARGAGDGEEGRVHLGGDTQHAVDQAGVEIHVGAHLLIQALVGAEDLGGKALDGFQQIEIVAKSLLVSLLAGKLLEKHGAGIGHRVNRVAHAINEAAAVACLLVEDLEEEGGQLVVVLGVLHACLDAVEHLHHLQVGTTVAGTLQGTDAACDGGVGVGTRGGKEYI